ncbi:hypothetical protein H0H93_016499 [Arthromyces matolae]|nr:hypothetical protein H0H93_016499 [Arthromyces matolae]
MNHNDVLAQNAGINVITNYGAWYLSGLRDPLEVRYAFYDFGRSLIRASDGNWSINEMNNVGDMLNIPFRHLQAQIPSLGLLLDDMQNSGDGLGLTASQALRRFQEIKASLTKEQLEFTVHNRLWNRKKGKAVSKAERPQHLPPNFVKWTG